MNHIEIIEGDITEASVDAIVNAANPKMLGGGVDGAIHKAAGPRLLDACREIKPENGIRCAFGSAQITSAGDLNARYVIHAVGPIFRNENNPEKVLEDTYYSVLKLVHKNACSSIAVPAGFPIESASKIVIEVCSKYSDINIKFYLLGKQMLNT